MLWKPRSWSCTMPGRSGPQHDYEYTPPCFPSSRTCCYDTSALRFREAFACRAASSTLRGEDQQLQSASSSIWFLTIPGQQASLLPGEIPSPRIILPFILKKIDPVTTLSKQCCLKFMWRPEKKIR